MSECLPKYECQVTYKEFNKSKKYEVELFETLGECCKWFYSLSEKAVIYECKARRICDEKNTKLCNSIARSNSRVQDNRNSAFDIF